MVSKTEDINSLIIESKLSGEISAKEISDGHHTFGELYRHRIALFCTLCNLFIAGINTPDGIVAYHIKLKYWEMFSIPELERAPKYDGYDSTDVIERVYSLSKIRKQ